MIALKAFGIGRCRRAIALVSAAAMTLPTVIAAQGTTAFVNATVIRGDGSPPLANQTLVVEASRIARLGPSVATQVPADARVIDARGKFIIPGLGDAHAHLSTPGGGQALAERALQLFALHGVTMVRSMYTEPHHAAAAEKAAREEIPGPRTMIVSPAATPQTLADSAMAHQFVKDLKAQGYPALKVIAASAPVFAALADEARRQGLPMVGHVPVEVGLHASLTAGFQSLEHLDGFIEALRGPGARVGGGFFGFAAIDSADTSRIRDLVADVKRSGVVIVPTEYSMETFVAPFSPDSLFAASQSWFAPAPLAQQWQRQKTGLIANGNVTAERWARYGGLRRQIIRELYAAGVPLAVGSDAFTMFDVPGPGTFAEMELLQRAGLSPSAVLMAATTTVAKLMGVSDETGTIQVGKAADLVLLTADPLADIANVRRQDGVMLRGKWYSANDISHRLSALRESK